MRTRREGPRGTRDARKRSPTPYSNTRMETCPRSEDCAAKAPTRRMRKSRKATPHPGISVFVIQKAQFEGGIKSNDTNLGEWVEWNRQALGTARPKVWG